MYAIRLSKEHEDLPIAELQAVLNAEDIDYSIEQRIDRLVFFDADTVSGLERLAMSFEVCELIHTFPAGSFASEEVPDVPVNGSFAVRKNVLDETATPATLERDIGTVIDDGTDHHVDLERPEEVFMLYIVAGQAHLCRQIFDIDRSGFEARANEHRPFQQPVVVHPRLARTLVNLSGVSSDGSVFDPFCGTGGILIEAGLIGCAVTGMDLQPHMVWGARENLAAYDVDGRIRKGDVAELPSVFSERFDAIVTDLPYGRGSKTTEDAVDAFLSSAPEMADALVFMSDQDDIGGYEPDFAVYVHGTMTRYIYVR